MAAALVDEAKRAPEHFSPNVLLRPLVQDTVFPTMCYVGGPNELAYLGQLKGVYARSACRCPLICQRGSATLPGFGNDALSRRRMSLPLTALHAADEPALNQLLESQLPPTVEQRLRTTTSP